MRVIVGATGGLRVANGLSEGRCVEFPERFELGGGIDFVEKVDLFRRSLVLSALRSGGTLTRGAQLLGVNRSTLSEMLKRYGIEEREWKVVPFRE